MYGGQIKGIEGTFVCMGVLINGVKGTYVCMGGGGVNLMVVLFYLHVLLLFILLFIVESFFLSLVFT